MYVDGREAVNIGVTASIRGDLVEERLRRALARVQGKHALLRCLIVRRGCRPWFEPQAPAPPIPLRVVERHRDDQWIEATRSELRRRFDGARKPLARLTWLRGERRSELLLVCHHAICDGRSLLTLLREILLLCDRPDGDIGGNDALHAVEELLPAEVWADRRLRRRVRYQVAALKLALRITRRVGSRRTWTYGEAYQTFWMLDEPDSRRLVERCKAEGVSVFAAMSFAFMLAFRAVRGSRAIRDFVAPVDVRRFLPHLPADSLFAIAPTVALSPGGLPDGAPVAMTAFWTAARTLKRDMDGKIDRLAPKVHARFLGMERLHDVYDAMTAYGRSRRAGRRVSLSYLGRLDFPRDYRDFRLQAVRGISAMLAPTPAHLIVVSSFGGRFDLSLASDESSLPYAQARAIQERAMETLRICAAPSTPHDAVLAREPPADAGQAGATEPA